MLMLIPAFLRCSTICPNQSIILPCSGGRQYLGPRERYALMALLASALFTPAIAAQNPHVEGFNAEGLKPFMPATSMMFDPHDERSTPTQVIGLTKVKTITAGGQNSFALKANGSVLAWGNNLYGQLGGITSPNRPISKLKNVIAIATGNSSHVIALKNDGTVWTWGADHSRNCDGHPCKRSIPTQMPKFSKVTAIAAGFVHSLARKSDGTVWAWGNNHFGQLGDGTTTKRLAPIQLINLIDVRVIAAGYMYSLAVKADGTVWTWGYDFSHPIDTRVKTLPKPTPAPIPVPTQVPKLSEIVSVASGDKHSLALKADGTVWAWGQNDFGQLGDSTRCIHEPCSRATPIQVPTLSHVMAIAAGGVHSIALKTDGTVWAWGRNLSGELGDGDFYLSRSTPTPVLQLSNVVAIAAGQFHSLALKTDGTVWAWGDNSDGQLGIGATQANCIHARRPCKSQPTL